MDWTQLEEHASGIVAGVARGKIQAKMHESGGLMNLELGGFDGEQGWPSLVVTMESAAAERARRAVRNGNRAEEAERAALRVIERALAEAGKAAGGLHATLNQPSGAILNQVSTHILADATVGMTGDE